MNIIATNSQSIDDISADFAGFLADSKISFCPRQRKSIKKLSDEYNARDVIVWEKSGPIMYSGGEKFFFHPSMAKVRISAYRKKGVLDPMIEACEIRENDHFLDCTLGLGADAIAASYFTPQGKVVGLEASAGICFTVKWGMHLYNSNMPWLNETIHRIKAINIDHNQYLQNLADNSFDIVYFDPMFRNPIYKSQAISPLREMANSDPLSEKSILEAMRVARRKVVIKERNGSSEFQRLKCHRIHGSRNNNVAFGVIDV